MSRILTIRKVISSSCNRWGSLCCNL